jgi:lipopolysaccharide O-acetyltransferase
VHRLARRAAGLLRSAPRRILYAPDRRRRYGPGPRAMSALRRRWLLLTHPHADIRFEPGVFVGPATTFHVPAGGRLVVGRGVELRRGFTLEIEGDGEVSIGAGSVFTYGVVVQCTTSIRIGERCMFGQGTMVVDGQHRFRDASRPMLDQGYDFAPVTIGDDAVITTKCTVMADVGQRAFVGANSVVTRPVPPFTVAVGAPARVIETFEQP